MDVTSHKATLMIVKSEKGKEATEFLTNRFPDIEVQEGQITTIIVLTPRQYDRVMAQTEFHNEKFQKETHLLYKGETIGVVNFNSELLEQYINDKMVEARITMLNGHVIEQSIYLPYKDIQVGKRWVQIIGGAFEVVSIEDGKLEIKQITFEELKGEEK